MQRSGVCAALYILEKCLQCNVVGCCPLPAEHHTFGGFVFPENSLGATHNAERVAKCSRQSCKMWNKAGKMLHCEIWAQNILTDTWRTRRQASLFRNKLYRSTEGTWAWGVLAALCSAFSPQFLPRPVEHGFKNLLCFFIAMSFNNQQPLCRKIKG